jgi:hypothetical protein
MKILKEEVEKEVKIEGMKGNGEENRREQLDKISGLMRNKEKEKVEIKKNEGFLT